METIKNGGASSPSLTKEGAILLQRRHLDEWRTKLTPRAFSALENWATERNERVTSPNLITWEKKALRSYVDVYEYEEGIDKTKVPVEIMVGGIKYQAYEIPFRRLVSKDRFIFTGNSTIWTVRSKFPRGPYYGDDWNMKIKSTVFKIVYTDEKYKSNTQLEGAPKTKGDRLVLKLIL